MVLKTQNIFKYLTLLVLTFGLGVSSSFALDSLDSFIVMNDQIVLSNNRSCRIVNGESQILGNDGQILSFKKARKKNRKKRGKLKNKLLSSFNTFAIQDKLLDLKIENQSIQRCKKAKNLKDLIYSLDSLKVKAGDKQAQAANKADFGFSSHSPDPVDFATMTPILGGVYVLDLFGSGFDQYTYLHIKATKVVTGTSVSGIVRPQDFFGLAENKISLLITEVNEDLKVEVIAFHLVGDNIKNIDQISEPYQLDVFTPADGSDNPDGGDEPNNPDEPGNPGGDNPGTEPLKCTKPIFIGPDVYTYADAVDGFHNIELEVQNALPPISVDPNSHGTLFAKIQGLNDFHSIVPYELINGKVVMKVEDGKQSDGVVSFIFYNTVDGDNCGSNEQITQFVVPSQSDGLVDIALKVQEMLPSGKNGVTRNGFSTYVPVPLAKGKVFDLNGRPQISITGASRFGCRSLGHWSDGSVKWAGCDITSSSTLFAGGVDSSLSVNLGSGLSSSSTVASVLASQGVFLLDTGVMQARLPQSLFKLLDRVVVNGKELVSSDNEASFGKSLTNGNIGTRQVTSYIESNGPARATLRFDGEFYDTVSNERVVDFTLKVSASYGSSDLETALTLRNGNINHPEHSIFQFVQLGFDLNVNASNAVVDTSDAQGLTGQVIYDLADVNSNKSDEKSNLYKPACLDRVFVDDKWNTTPDGYRLVNDGSFLHGFGNANDYSEHPALQVKTSIGSTPTGVTVSIKDLAYVGHGRYRVDAPSAGKAEVSVSPFYQMGTKPCYVKFKQHDTSEMLISFHASTPKAPEVIARGFNYPVYTRFANYEVLNDVLNKKVLSVERANLYYDTLGLNTEVYVDNSSYQHIVYLYKSTTGGWNNYPKSSTNFYQDLRFGAGGKRKVAIQTALYKAEKQIIRTDAGWDYSKQKKSSTNDAEIETTDGDTGDVEHLYRDGLILAYYLSGNTLFKEALIDEAEVRKQDPYYPQTRWMARAVDTMSYLINFFAEIGHDDPELQDWLENEWLAKIDADISDDGGYSAGWQTVNPDTGDRRYWATISSESPCDGKSTRGFMVGSMLPIGLANASELLGESTQLGSRIRGRMRDAVFYTREELFPSGQVLSQNADPSTRFMAYRYCITAYPSLSAYANMENVWFHPVSPGMMYAYEDTGDYEYARRALEALQAFASQCHSVGCGQKTGNDLFQAESRLEVQNAIYKLYNSCYLDNGCRAYISDLIN